jgi:hypothetical protein
MLALQALASSAVQRCQAQHNSVAPCLAYHGL